MKIHLGEMPHPKAYCMAVRPQETPTEPHVPYVATTVLSGMVKNYAGTGRVEGDKVHFEKGAWHAKPQTLQEAIKTAGKMADEKNFSDWVQVHLPKDLY